MFAHISILEYFKFDSFLDFRRTLIFKQKKIILLNRISALTRHCTLFLFLWLFFFIFYFLLVCCCCPQNLLIFFTKGGGGDEICVFVLLILSWCCCSYCCCYSICFLFLQYQLHLRTNEKHKVRPFVTFTFHV